MIRILAPCLLLLLGLPAAAQAPSEQKPAAEQGTSAEQKASIEPKPAAVLCVYNSKNYSEGATVCVQKAMMQTCMLDGIRAIWVAVTDEKLSSRCTAPAPRLSKYQRAAIWNRRSIAREIAPAIDSAPFCYYTNGKRFCE
ncbi:DUF1496 domain-containing protein [Afipia birgiae]|jgi:hypothetical protein|uniref:DUF1496 domain-containing protein n=1 Tax=Afipia birgiae TaxID=151414 RepID=UPI0002DD1639|nr:DUF1496 domain-containing protein [Afipia birgiae]MBX9823100.1 DUF1496 domain-containing protein [Afipia birgiae]